MRFVDRYTSIHVLACISSTHTSMSALVHVLTPKHDLVKPNHAFMSECGVWNKRVKRLPTREKKIGKKDEQGSYVGDRHECRRSLDYLRARGISSHLLLGFWTFEASLIVKPSLCWIRQSFVGFADLHEISVTLFTSFAFRIFLARRAFVLSRAYRVSL
jgi:hypothetical protein